MYLKQFSFTLAILTSLLFLGGSNEVQAGDSPIKVKPLTYRADSSDVKTENVGFGFYGGRYYRRSYYGGYGYGRYYRGFGYRGFYGGYYRPYGFYRPYSYFNYGYGYRYPFAYRAAYPYNYSVGYYGPRYSLYNTYYNYTRPYYVSTYSTAYVAPTFSTCCSVPVVRQTCNYGYTCAPLNCCQPVCGCDETASSGPVIINKKQSLPELAPEQNTEPIPPKPEAEQPTPPQPAEGVET